MSFLTTNILDTWNKDYIGSRQLANKLNEFYAVQRGSTFPPYNIIETENGFEVQLAVAGFDKSEIEISCEESNLVIIGKHESKINPESFIHCGIANRSFERKFLLRENVKVMDEKAKLIPIS